jgi:hypothetical protein
MVSKMLCSDYPKNVTYKSESVAMPDLPLKILSAVNLGIHGKVTTIRTHNGQQAPSVADEGQRLRPGHLTVGPSGSKLILQWTNCAVSCQLLVMWWQTAQWHPHTAGERGHDTSHALCSHTMDTHLRSRVTCLSTLRRRRSGLLFDFRQKKELLSFSQHPGGLWDPCQIL